MNTINIYSVCENWNYILLCLSYIYKHYSTFFIWICSLCFQSCSLPNELNWKMEASETHQCKGSNMNIQPELSSQMAFICSAKDKHAVQLHAFIYQESVHLRAFMCQESVDLNWFPNSSAARWKHLLSWNNFLCQCKLLHLRQFFRATVVYRAVYIRC